MLIEKENKILQLNKIFASKWKLSKKVKYVLAEFENSTIEKFLYFLQQKKSIRNTTFSWNFFLSLKKLIKIN